MRFLVELDHPLNTWKSKLFLSEATHLQPTLIGVPVVAEPGEDDLLRRWCERQAVYSPELQHSENKEALRRLAPHVRDSVTQVDGCRLLVHSPVSTMESVWEVLGVSAKRMLNTQVCVNVSTSEVAFCSVPGGRRIDIDKLSRVLGGTWRRATRQELRELGQNAGAISPLTANLGVRVVIDVAVPGTGLVFVGSGDPTVSIVIDTDRNKALASAVRADVSED